MKIIRSPRELITGGRKVCLAIGFFDGVHLGHQQIIRQTITDARQSEAVSVVVTFDHHPSAVVAPDHVPPLIHSLPQRLRAIGSLGAEAILLIHFDRAFSQQSGETFIRGLAADFGQLQSLCVGSNFTFGCRRSGDVSLLKILGKELKFAVHGLSVVSLGGKAVNSTRIRETIRTGNFNLAGQLLGRGYSLCGIVQRGDQIGRTLGFPTANLEVNGLVVPPNGVYAVHAETGGQTYRAALNIGSRPTLSQPEPRLQVEAHLLDYAGDLYGQEMEISFVKKLRDEQKFPSLPALASQIARDMAAAKSAFN